MLICPFQNEYMESKSVKNVFHRYNQLKAMVKVMYQPSCSVNIVPILPCLHISQQDGIVLDFHDKNVKKHRENIVIFYRTNVGTHFNAKGCLSVQKKHKFIPNSNLWQNHVTSNHPVKSKGGCDVFLIGK